MQGRELVRGRYQLVAFGISLALMFVAFADRGQAQPEHAPGLRITSPAAGALVTSRTVRLKVKGAGKRVVKVFNGPRRLKIRLSEPRRGVRTARLRRKRDLHRGTNVISIRAGRGFDQREIVLGRKRGGLLSVSKAVRRTGRGGPVRARARVAASVDSFRVRLNGRRVEEAFEPVGAKLRSAALNAGHGVRFGSNRMVVTGYRADGRFDREIRRFRVSRSHPLAGAGRDRSSRAGRPLRLDGRSSKPTRRGSGLRYRWRVVSGPHHKRVRLRGARSARPRVIANRPGRYRIKLKVRQHAPARSRSRGGGKPGRKRATTMAQGPRRGGAPGIRAASASDTTTVTVAPSLPPIGAPITISPADDRVTIGGKDYPRPSGQGSGPQLLVLDRKTLVENTEAAQGYDFDSGGWGSLADVLVNLETSGRQDLVVLTGGGRDVGCDSACQPVAKMMLEAVGGTWSEHRDMQVDLGSGEWALIGVPGSASGSAVQSIGGGLDGYLQPDNNLNFKFVFGDYVPIDTSSVPGEVAGRNLISVGGKTYPSQSADYRPGYAGFQVLALYQDDLTSHLAETYWTNSSATAVNPEQVDEMTADLEVLAEVGMERPLLVIIQSIGTPNPGGKNWQSWAKSLPSAIAGVGGTEAVIRTLNLGSEQSGQNANHIGEEPGGYSLVGGTDLAGFGAEQTYWYTGQPARINGMLTRNNQAQFEIAHAGPVATSSADGLSQVAYQAPTPWPVSGTAGERAANTYITHRLGFSQNDLRVAYYENDSVATWTSKWQILQGVEFPGGSPGFTKAEFAAVKKQLLSEIEMVEQVRGMIRGYKTNLFGPTSEDSALVHLQSIAHQIEQAVSVKGNEGVSSAAEAEEITGLLLGVAAEAGGMAGPEVAIGLSAASAAFEIAGTVSDDEQGNPLPGKVAATADQLGIELADRYTTITDALDHVGDLLVSDYGKLKVANQEGASKWSLNSGEIAAAQNGLKVSSQRWIYGALMPAAYKVYGLGWSWNSGTRVTDPYYYRCYSRKYEGSLLTDWELHNRFEDADWSTYYLSRSNSGIWYPQILSTWIDFHDDSQRHYLSPNNENATPPTWLTQRLFSSPLQGDGNLGMNQPTFFARSGFDHITMDCYDKQ